jgi:hypothetical protein
MSLVLLQLIIRAAFLAVLTYTIDTLSPVRAILSAQQLFNGINELNRFKGLDNVGIGSDFHAPIAIKDFPFQGTNDHRDIFGFWIRLETTTHLITIHAGHDDIEDDEIRIGSLNMFEGFHPIRGDRDLNAAIAE